MKVINTVFVLLFMCFIVSCATTYGVKYDYDKQADFENLKTYDWMTVPEKIDTFELFSEAIKFKVAFVPGKVFYGENPDKNHMRINFSYPSKDQLAEAVKRLSDCVKNYS